MARASRSWRTGAACLAGVSMATLLHLPAAGATVPGDNGRIAFTDFRDGASGIFTVGPDGSGLARLTTAPTNHADEHPAWSPDGTQIAFTRRNWIKHTTEIFVVGANGAALRPLTSTPDRYVGFPAWSPDGSRLVVTTGPPIANGPDFGNGGPWHLALVDAADGKVVRTLTAGADVRDVAADWSPDGRRIVFQRHHGTREHEISSGRVQLLDVATSGVEDVAPGRVPRWTPDGTAFVSTALPVDAAGRCSQPCRSQVFLTNVRDRSRTQLTTGSENTYDPTVSPDGRRLAWTTVGRGIVHARTDGGDVRPVVRGSQPDWQAIQPLGRAFTDLLDDARDETTGTGGDLLDGLSLGRVVNLLPALGILPEIDLSSAAPAVPRLPALPLPASGATIRYVTQLGDETPRPQASTIGALALLEVDGRAGADLQAQLLVTPDGLRLTVKRAGLTELSGLPVRVEVFLDDAAAQAARGRGLVPTTQLRFGFDAREDVMPFSVEQTLRQPGPHRLRAGVVSVRRHPLGRREAARMDLVAGLTDRTSTPERTTDVTVDLDPLPETVDVAVDLDDPLRLEAAVSQKTTVVADLKDGPSPQRVVRALVVDVPAATAPPDGALLNPRSVAVSYAPHRRRLQTHAAAVVPKVDFRLTNDDAAGHRDVHVVANGIPTEVDVDLRAGSSVDAALVGVYQASGVLGDITIDVVDPSGLTAGATVMRLYAERVARRVDVRLGDPNGSVIDARPGEIGKIEVTLGDDRGDLARVPVPPARDGLWVSTKSDDRLVFARLTGLRSLRFVTAGSRADACGDPGYTLCAELTKTGARPFTVDLQRPFPRRRTNSDPRVEFVRATLDSAQPTTTFRFGVQDGAVRAFYDASQPATRFDLDTNAGGDPERINLHVDVVPVPKRLEFCVTGESGLCAARNARYRPIASLRFDASQRVAVTVRDQLHDVRLGACEQTPNGPVCSEQYRRGLEVSASLSNVTILASSNTGTPLPIATCPGGPGEVFVDTGGAPLAVQADMHSYDTFCEDGRHLTVRIPDGFWADARYARWDHPLQPRPTNGSGRVHCPAGTKVHVVDAIAFDPTGDQDIDLDDFLCHGSSKRR